MKILKGDVKVRATELVLLTSGAKATVIRLRRWYYKFLSSFHETGKTGATIATDLPSNQGNEINRDRLRPIERSEATTTDVHDDDDHVKNFDDENLENELRELMMFAVSTTDGNPRA